MGRAGNREFVTIQIPRVNFWSGRRLHSGRQNGNSHDTTEIRGNATHITRQHTTRKPAKKTVQDRHLQYADVWIRSLVTWAISRVPHGVNASMMRITTEKTQQQETSSKWRTFDLVRWVWGRRLQWFGHILRMGSERKIKQSVVLVEGSRKTRVSQSCLSSLEVHYLQKINCVTLSRIRSINGQPSTSCFHFTKFQDPRGL